MFSKGATRKIRQRLCTGLGRQFCGFQASLILSLIEGIFLVSKSLLAYSQVAAPVLKKATFSLKQQRNLYLVDSACEVVPRHVADWLSSCSWAAMMTLRFIPGQKRFVPTSERTYLHIVASSYVRELHQDSLGSLAVCSGFQSPRFLKLQGKLSEFWIGVRIPLQGMSRLGFLLKITEVKPYKY